MSTTTQALMLALRFARREIDPSMGRLPGIALALYRTAAMVTAAQVAQRLDLSKQGVSKMESGTVTVEAAGRYRAAVDQIVAERIA